MEKNYLETARKQKHQEIEREDVPENIFFPCSTNSSLCQAILQKIKLLSMC